MNNSVRFSNFSPLKAAIDKDIFGVIGNYPVKEELIQFPLFRAGVVDPSTGKVAPWWLWNGESEERIGSLSEEQKHLPIRGIWNDTLLFERIESGWTPFTDLTT